MCLNEDTDEVIYGNSANCFCANSLNTEFTPRPGVVYPVPFELTYDVLNRKTKCFLFYFKSDSLTEFSASKIKLKYRSFKTNQFAK